MLTGGQLTRLLLFASVLTFLLPADGYMVDITYLESAVADGAGDASVPRLLEHLH